jgi:acyl carrier protein
MNDADFQVRLCQTIQSFTNVAIDELGPDDKLLSSGLIDSMNIVEIILLVEQYWGFRVDPTELSMDNFDSLASINRYVQRKLNGEL